MSEEVTATLEDRVATLEGQQVALSQDIANLIAVLLHNEIIFVNKNEDGTITF